MDPGSDPRWDDYGLPRVDIEIPDDARDLDRDVQAYHRELRAQRRQDRIRRLAGPLIRHGMVLPLVAGCLALSLLAGTLLTVLGGRQVLRPLARLPATVSHRPATPAVPSGDPAVLPDSRVLVNGRPVRLRRLLPALLAWVPPTCGCQAALTQLARQAGDTDVTMYVVGPEVAMSRLLALASQAGQRSDHVAGDIGNQLRTAYHLAGPTAILARQDGTVGDVLSGLSPTPGIEDELRSIAPLPASGTLSPAGSTVRPAS